MSKKHTNIRENVSFFLELVQTTSQFKTIFHMHLDYAELKKKLKT